MVCCDGKGLARIIHGHCPGSLNDLENYYSSELYTEPGLYFGLGTKAIADGSFARVEVDRFISPVCYIRGRGLTVQETRFNIYHSWDRSIVENFFGRMKLYCPVIQNFRFAVDKINIIFTAAVIMTNIRIKYQSPLRNWN